jgi:uncharacterized protein YjiS (DUF1127 family)
MTTIDNSLSVHVERRPLRALVKQALNGLSALIIALMDWHDRARQRRQLLALSDGALKDFAASRADAEREGSKPFWQR